VRWPAAFEKVAATGQRQCIAEAVGGVSYRERGLLQ
jgi:hypothetical protein